MRDTVAGTDAATWRDPALRDELIGALEYQADVLGLLGAYRAMFLQQMRWHDTLDPAAHAAWAEARDEYVTLADAHLETYTGDLDHPAWNLDGRPARRRPCRPRRGHGVDRPRPARARPRLARHRHGRLAHAPGAQARGRRGARAWLASTRPWRARESTLGLLPLDRWLLSSCPAALLVATRAVQTSFLSWTHLALVLGAWLVFVLVVPLFLRRRSPWPVIAAVGGVVVLRCIVTLTPVVHRSGRLLVRVLDRSRAAHALHLDRVRAVRVGLRRGRLGAVDPARPPPRDRRRAHRRRRGLAVPAAVVAVIGLEPVLSAWNDQMGLLPWGLARILGLTTYLEIPADTAWWAAAFGAVVCAVGLLLAVPWEGAAPSRGRGRIAASRPLPG